MKLYNIRTQKIDIISILLSFTFYANLVQIKPVSRLSLLENVLCNPCSLACFLSYFHFYVYMMQSHSWMSYLTKEYTEKEILYLENVNRTSLFTLMGSPFILDWFISFRTQKSSKKFQCILSHESRSFVSVERRASITQTASTELKFILPLPFLF